MIGLVIVTHGRLAEELRLAVEHVVGPQPKLAAICIGPEDDSVCRCEEVRERILQVDEGDGVILLTDMFGGTPSNLCIAQMSMPGVEVLAGVNLPMLVKLAKVRRSMSLADAVSLAQAAGRKYIAAASEVIPRCRELQASPIAPVTAGSGVSAQAISGIASVSKSSSLRSSNP